uniref:Uncharacterized protein n=1 Tax=Parascaris equorum TaxID=6256 RepID=A0A914RTZ1_PAREQ
MGTNLSTRSLGGACTLSLAISFGATFAGNSSWFARAASANGLPYFKVN